MAGREIDVAVHLLDRQVVDPDGMLLCKVDDVELTVPEEGGAPYVSAILAGPAALGPRLGGVLARWVRGRSPARIDFGVVSDVSSRVSITLRREGLGANAVEAWCRDNVVAKIPGATHASE